MKEFLKKLNYKLLLLYFVTTIFLGWFFIKGMIWVYLGFPKSFWIEPLFLNVFN